MKRLRPALLTWLSRLNQTGLPKAASDLNQLPESGVGSRGWKMAFSAIVANVAEDDDGAVGLVGPRPLATNPART